MTACGKDMGGIWIPIPSGHAYFPIRCNRIVIHKDSECKYTDVRSGNQITKNLLGGDGLLTVNERGWVGERR